MLEELRERHRQNLKLLNARRAVWSVAASRCSHEQHAASRSACTSGLTRGRPAAIHFVIELVTATACSTSEGGVTGGGTRFALAMSLGAHTAGSAVTRSQYLA